MIMTLRKKKPKEFFFLLKAANSLKNICILRRQTSTTLLAAEVACQIENEISFYSFLRHPLSDATARFSNSLIRRLSAI